MDRCMFVILRCYLKKTEQKKNIDIAAVMLFQSPHNGWFSKKKRKQKLKFEIKNYC